MLSAIKNALETIGSSERVQEYLLELNKCDWLEHIRTVLAVSVSIKDFILDKCSVIVHCR